MESNIKRTFSCGITGHVKEGFEPVIKQLETYYGMGYEKNCQLTVYVKEECVIDIVMSNHTKGSKTKIDVDTVGCVYSSGKTIGAILLAKMVDEGRLNYSDPISKVWPEFAQNGKEAMTLADVMRHESGMSKLSKPIDPAWLTAEGLKSNNVGKIIEEEGMNFNGNPDW